jgi:hypothetical protein
VPYIPPEQGSDFRPPRKGADPITWFGVFAVVAALALYGLSVAVR